MKPKPPTNPTSTSSTAPPPTTAIDIDALLNRAAVSLSRHQKLVESWIPLTPAEKQAAAGQSNAGGSSTSNPNAGKNGRAREAGIEDVAIRPERAGLGAPLTSTTSTNTTAPSTLETLRKQLLGRKAAAASTKYQHQHSTPHHQGKGGHSKGAPTAPGATARLVGDWRKGGTVVAERNGNGGAEEDDDDDEEEGRAGAFRSKRVKMAGAAPVPAPAPALMDMESAPHAAQIGTRKTEPDTDINVADDVVAGAQEQERDHKTQPPTTVVAQDSQTQTQTQTRGTGSYLDEVLAAREEKKRNKKKRKKEKEEKSSDGGVAAAEAAAKA